MDLLSNLVQFGNTQSTSLDLCQSPKAIQTPYHPPLMSAQKQPIPQSDRPRPASKSLSKMSFFSPVQKIDPKQRLIHRLFYKLQMKCRKHYYNFFVKLQNLKRKPVNMKNSKLVAAVPKVTQKLSQTYDLLFSKYFSRTLLKDSFKRINKMAKLIEGVRKMGQMISSRKIKEYFSKICTYSKQIQKNHIRIDILASSLSSLALSCKKQTRVQLKSYAFSQILKYSSSRFSSPTPKLSAFSIQQKQDEIFESDISSFNLIKEIDIIPHPKYQHLKQAKRICDSSPTKPCNRINLKISQQYKNPFQRANYLKTCSIKIDQLLQYPLQGRFSKQTSSSFVKKCELDKLNSKQVNDIYDNNTLFFPTELKNLDYLSLKPKQTSLFSQSLVETVQLQHSNSQSSLISPLCQTRQINCLNFSVNSARSNSFGLQAVNFKNSLVSERESMKDQVFGQKKQEKVQQMVFKKNHISKQAKKNEFQLQQFANAEENSLKLRIDQNIKQSGRKTPNFYNKMMINSSRQPYIQSQTEKKLIQGRKSIEQPKRNSFKEDSRKQQQTFLKITKKN